MSYKPPVQIKWNDTLKKYVYPDGGEVPREIITAYQIHWSKIGQWNIKGRIKKKNIEFTYKGLDHT